MVQRLVPIARIADSALSCEASRSRPDLDRDLAERLHGRNNELVMHPTHPLGHPRSDARQRKPESMLAVTCAPYSPLCAWSISGARSGLSPMRISAHRDS
jgi:hypothetical protein